MLCCDKNTMANDILSFFVCAVSVADKSQKHANMQNFIVDKYYVVEPSIVALIEETL